MDIEKLDRDQTIVLQSSTWVHFGV